MGQFVRMVFQGSGKGFQHLDAFIQRAPCPVRERLARGLHRRFHLRGGGTVARPHHLLGHRVQRLKEVALAFQPTSCDVQRIHYLDSRAADKATART